jgi:hypothetical protein
MPRRRRSFDCRVGARAHCPSRRSKRFVDIRPWVLQRRNNLSIQAWPMSLPSSRQAPWRRPERWRRASKQLASKRWSATHIHPLSIRICHLEHLRPPRPRLRHAAVRPGTCHRQAGTVRRRAGHRSRLRGAERQGKAVSRSVELDLRDAAQHVGAGELQVLSRTLNGA